MRQEHQTERHSQQKRGVLRCRREEKAEKDFWETLTLIHKSLAVVKQRCYKVLGRRIEKQAEGVSAVRHDKSPLHAGCGGFL